MTDKNFRFRFRAIIALCLLGLALIGQPVAAQLDPGNPPTDDLDYEEFQKKVAAMLPAQPDLLQFSTICVFPFAPWPEGIGQAAARFEEAFRGYSLKVDQEKILLLDRSGRTVFSYDGRTKKQKMVATDHQKASLQFDDFAMLRDSRLAVADNSRNELLIFAGNRLDKRLGFDGDRILFRHIDFVESDRLGINLVLFDSGRNRTFVFNQLGNLSWETEGNVEPCFYGNSLVRLDKGDKTLQIQRLSDITRTPVTIADYTCEPANIILDAWLAGTFAGHLAVVVYEGRGDEDHPDYARLLLIKDSKMTVQRFMPNLDFRLPLLTPYRLLFDRSGARLITARLSPQGVEIIGAPVSLK